MNREIVNLVARSIFATPGQRQIALLGARLSNKNGVFWLARGLAKSETQLSPSTVSEHLSAMASGRLIEKVGKQGTIAIWRFNLETVKKLAAGELEFKMHMKVVHDRGGQPKMINGVKKTRGAWHLVPSLKKVDDSRSQSNSPPVQISNDLREDTTRIGPVQSENRTQIEANNTKPTTSPTISAREARQAACWGEWQEFRKKIEFAETDSATAHVAQFINSVRCLLAPPKHFSDEICDTLIDRLKRYSPSVLCALAEQQIEVQIVRLASVIQLTKSADALSARQGPTIPTDEPIAQPRLRPHDLPPEMRRLHQLVERELPFGVVNAFRQLCFLGLRNGAAIFSGHSFLVDCIEKDHKAVFEHLVKLCVDGVVRVDFQRDKPCR